MSATANRSGTMYMSIESEDEGSSKGKTVSEEVDEEALNKYLHMDWMQEESGTEA